MIELAFALALTGASPQDPGPTPPACAHATFAGWQACADAAEEGSAVYALAMINLGARISVCGMISQYNATAPTPGPYNLINILARRAKMQGFIVTDYLSRAQEAIPELIKWHAEGRLKYRVEVVEGLNEAPRALNKLFDGSNQGKLIIKV